MGNSNIVRALKRLYRRVRHDRTHNQPVWRTVERGPLRTLQFLLPSGEGAGWANRFLQGEYEPQMLSALTELARAGGVLYDIGAHMGFYTCAWLLLGGDTASVEAFEPAPYNLHTLQRNIERNNLADRTNIHPLALGDRNGQANLIASEADIGAASAAHIDGMGYVDWPTGSPAHSLSNTHTVSVPIRRLDDLFAEKNLPPPTAIKLDVEGAEAAVLAGAERLLAEHRPAILCELHNIEAAVEVADRLAKLGYALSPLGKNGAQPAYLWLPPTSRVDV